MLSTVRYFCHVIQRGALLHLKMAVSVCLHAAGTTKDDAGKIDNMFEKLGKIGVHLSFREKSGVWVHFGELLVSLGETYIIYVPTIGVGLLI